MLKVAAITLLLVAPLVVMEQVHHHQGMRLEAQPGDDPRNAFRDAEFRRDKEHIQEHLQDKKIDLSNASPEELDFHFFKMHDSDGNNKLDGLELFGAMSHAFESQMAHLKKIEADNPDRYHRNMDVVNDHIIMSTDKILAELDSDDDGFINYMEYTRDIRTKNQLNHMAKHYAKS